MKHSMIAVMSVAVLLMASSIVSAENVAGWNSFVIRNPASATSHQLLVIPRVGSYLRLP